MPSTACLTALGTLSAQEAGQVTDGRACKVRRAGFEELNFRGRLLEGTLVSINTEACTDLTEGRDTWETLSESQGW